MSNASGPSGSVKQVRKPYFLRVGVHDQVLFLKHMTVMLDAGIPLRETLETIQIQTDSVALRYAISVAVKDLSDGHQLNFSLKRFPTIFDSFFINVVRVGEASGSLAQAVQYLGTQMQKAEEIRSQVRSAMLYPAIIFSGAIGIALYLTFFILPQLLPLFSSLSVNLPLSTRILLAIVKGLRLYWPIALAVLGGTIVVSSVLWKKVVAVRYAFTKISLLIPVIGHLSREIQTTQFSRILGTLLTSGVKVVPALRVTADSVSNLVYRKELQEVAFAVERGGTIGEELGKYPKLFSRTTVSMISVGERTGGLPKSLIAIAEFSEHEVEGMTKNLTTLIEPIVLLLVGLMVGFVALSIVSPIYQLTQGLTN